MDDTKRWLLPDGVEEILPAEAGKLESIRRTLLDLYKSWGYQLVITPLIEYLDSLIVGSSHDLELQTFKIIDQLSGRMMGIRADVTPQVARIDSHRLDKEGPARLCYSDNVLHTKPRGIMTSRVPIRIGAELFGHKGINCDVELICLMYESLGKLGINDIYIVLGHVGIFRKLVDEARLEKSAEDNLFEAVQRKAFDEIDDIVNSFVPDKNAREMLRSLTRLSGDESILAKALDIFESAPPNVRAELKELSEITRKVKERVPQVNLCFDLCELRGYEYHTGIVFAAYSSNYGRAIAKGGRYDHIGEVFGRARPASGFDSDLKVLAKLSSSIFEKTGGVLAPDIIDESLQKLIENLRESGEIVITNLSNEKLTGKVLEELDCDRHLVNEDGAWVVRPL
jgi:ATP phosphoribosyltransferase regulatory subunit